MPVTTGRSYHEKLKTSLEEVGFSFTSKLNCNPSVKITNHLYFCLQQLMIPLNERRIGILKLLGESSRQAESQLLNVKSISNFDRKFKKDRDEARRTQKIDVFDQTLVDLTKLGYFPLSSVSSDNQPPILSRMAPYRPPQKRTKKVPKKVIELENYNRRLAYNKNVLNKTRRDLKIARQEQIQLHKLKKKAETLSDEKSLLEARCVSLNNRILELENSLTIAHDELEVIKNEQPEKRQCFLKDRGAFTPEANFAFGELSIRCGITQEKIGLAIFLIANLLGIIVDALPSVRTIGRSFHAVSYASSKQIQEFLENSTNVTLMSDETTKKYHKLQAYVASGINKITGIVFMLYFGVFEVPNKSSARSFSELESVIKCIARTVGLEESGFWQNFLISVKNLMGDRAATQISFNNILAKCRAAFVQSLPGFGEMDDTEKEKALRVNSLFCILHVIHNLTKVIMKSLLEHEKTVTGTSDLSQPTVEWVITEISRYFGSRSSGKHPSAGIWKRVAEERGWDNAKISNLLGHRFNIVQVIASQILYNKERLVNFIHEFAPDLENKHGLASALTNPGITQHLQILATVDSLITGPLWRLSENSESVLKTREYAQELLVFLNRVQQQPMLFFACEGPLEHFENGKPRTIQSKAIRQFLEDLEPVTGSSEIIPSLAADLHCYFSEMFKFELSSDYTELSEVEVAGGVSSNRACESVFGFVDYLYTKAPNMTTAKRSIVTVALKNQVFEWLRTLSPEQYNKILIDATAARSSLEQQSIESAKKLKLEMFEEIEKHALQQKNSAEKNRARLDKIKVEVEKIGFWEVEEEMELYLSTLSNQTKKVEAVKTNIRYRKFIYQVNSAEDNLFRFSRDGNQFNLETLKNNLSLLMKL